MHTDIEQAVVDGNSEDRWSSLLSDDRQPTFLGVSQ